MNQICKALVLASAMLIIALLAVNDIVPASVAEFSPLAMAAFLPWVLNKQTRKCGDCT